MCSYVTAAASWRAVLYIQFRFGILLILCCLPLLSYTLTVHDLYPFDLKLDNRTKDLDDSASELLLDVDFPFYNRSDYRNIFVNNNGIISFIYKLVDYQPDPLHAVDKRIALIAPFWSDIDIEHVKYNKTSNKTQAVLFRVTDEQDIKDRFSQDVADHFLVRFEPTLVLIVTWYNVGFYGAFDADTNKRNTFQAVLATDSRSSYVIYNYLDITWTTGANSGGEGGVGGEAAVIGFHSGDVTRTYSLPQSGTADVINITQDSNIDVKGKFIFKVDGPTIVDLQCKGISTLEVFPKSVSTLGREAIIIKGPCTVESVSPKVRFTSRLLNVEVSCSILDDRSVLCVTPTFFYTGEVTLEYNPLGTDWGYPTPYTINPISGTQPLLERENPDDWTTGRMVRLSWEQVWIPTGIERTLEVLAYSHTDDVPSFVVLQSIGVTDDVTSRRFNLLTSARVPLGDKDILVTRLCYTTSQQGVNTLPQCIWSDVFPLLNNTDNSVQWCKNWLKSAVDVRETQINPTNCPCVLGMAENDLSNFHVDPFCDRTKSSSLNCIYQKKAHTCMRRNIKSPTDTGESCCYDSKGELMDIRQYSGAGTHHLHHYQAQGPGIVPYFSYFRSDLLPKLHCCQYSSQFCRLFRNFRRETTCVGYKPPSPAQAAGDPHLVTLDGKNYSFNGLGEFVLVQDINNTLVIQVRTVQAVDSNGLRQNATVFSSVAITARNVSDVIEIRKREDREAEETSEVLVNGFPHKTDITTSQFNGISLQQNSSRPGSYLVVLKSISVSVTVEVTPDLMNIIVLIGESALQGNLRGLLGNYNGDQSDDFIARDGTRLPPDARMKEIHFDFGMTWAVRPKESILATANITEDPDFQPVFIDEQMSSVDLRNDTDVICGDNQQCRYDYMLTGKKEAAQEFVSFNQKFDSLQKELNRIVVRCPFVDVPANGNRTLEGQSVGSLATFTCDPGYEMLGSPERRCDGDGTWTGQEVLCINPVSTPRPDIELYIYTGSGVLGLVVIVIVVVIVIKIYCKRRPKPQEHEDIEMDDRPTHTDSAQPIFQNQEFMERLHGMVRDGVYRIPRPKYVDPNIFQEYF